MVLNEIKFKLWSAWRIPVRHLEGMYGQGIWRILPFLGTSVIVSWPTTEDTADPNEIMRPWLEENAGKQGVHWSWGIDRYANNHLRVSFLNKEHALMFKLIYG